MRILLAVLTAFVSFSLFFLFMHFKAKKKQKMVKKIGYFSGEGSYEKDEVKKEKKSSSFMAAIKSLAEKWRKLHKNSNLEHKMQEADWPLLGSEFQILLGGFSLLVGLFMLLLTFDPVFFVGGAALGIFSGMLFLKITIYRRRKAFLNQLGDTLVMVSNALRAGFSFLQAMELISREMEAPIGVEFQKVINEANLGTSMEVSLQNMADRMQSKDFDLVVTAVLIQRQIGGNLSQILDSISDTIMERIRMRNEISALTSQGKLSGLIVGAIPFGIVGFVKWQNPAYFDPMLASPTGRMMLVGAVVLEILAVFVIRKIVDIDV